MRCTAWPACSPPQPLYAFGVGGSALVRDLSFFDPVTYTDSLEFVAAVPDGNVSNVSTQFGTPGIQVRAFTKLTHTPLIGVSIQLDVVGNGKLHRSPLGGLDGRS